MTGPFDSWLALMLATDAPALPSPSVMQLWLRLGWSAVLAWVGVVAMGRFAPVRARGGAWPITVAGLLAMSAWLPGPYSPAYWLGLAFQAPSVVTALLCAGMLAERLVPSAGAQWSAPAPNRLKTAFAYAGLVLGWALLLDTFALLPLQLYAWGNSAAAVGLVVLVAAVLWVVLGSAPHPVRAHLWVVPMALMVFAAWRLPTGNVWDAILDPWLWVALHVYLVRRIWVRNRSRGFPLIT
ncbi:MAG: hypothetical protein Q7T07_13485 [Burkholderiaceae bacterium]|nr:hypothetical protein [Burkholderiaceae bacterium]